LIPIVGGPPSGFFLADSFAPCQKRNQSVCRLDPAQDLWRNRCTAQSPAGGYEYVLRAEQGVDLRHEMPILGAKRM
jgi:hypothetical protein